MFQSRWLPKSVAALRGYDLATFRADAIAGVTVGLVALPLAMAFAIASGLTPQAGIYCAVVTGFVISALGGSRVQIGGPTGAFVVVVSGIVAKYGVAGLYLCTMMAGVILVVLGATRSGSAVRFIPRPVVVGFTNGIAVLIASTQIKDFLGLRTTENPGEFAARLGAIVRHLDTVTPAAVLLAVFTLVLVVATNRFVKAVPGTIVGLVGGTALGWLGHLPIDTVGSRFGGVPSGLPAFQIPPLQASLFLTLLSPALTVALGRTAIFCGAREQPRAVMTQAGFAAIVGADNVCSNIDAALTHARIVAAPGTHDATPVRVTSSSVSGPR